jgi:hypothetical protein
MPLNIDDLSKATPAELMEISRELTQIKKTLPYKAPGQDVKGYLPLDYAKLLPECIDYAYLKIIDPATDQRLINRRSIHAFTTKAVKEYITAIVLDARQNGIYIGLKEETPNNTTP